MKKSDCWMPNERKAFLKRVLKIVAIVLAVVIAPFALVGGYVAVDRLIGNIYYDRTKTEIKLSGNIFDEPLMKKVDLAFLQKPENGADESFSAKQYYVSYICFAYQSGGAETIGCFLPTIICLQSNRKPCPILKKSLAEMISSTPFVIRWTVRRKTDGWTAKNK